MERLITDISNASRLDAELARDAPTPIDIVQLLRDIVSTYGETIGTGSAEVVFAPFRQAQNVHINGREGPLSQVFRNLIDNAKSFSPSGGKVVVQLRKLEGEIQISVEDDGPGMHPENLETVFERFYTSRPKGTAFGGNSGLGLAIARQIVEAHGGRIWAENRGGRAGDGATGARFTVALPLG